MIIGYTTGVFDMFHIGHLNLLRNAKSMCDKLIVGVSVDKLVQYKGKTPVIPYEDRAEIVRCCKFVDLVVPQYDMDKLTACKKLSVDLMFVGDDWYNTEKWINIENQFKDCNIKIIYFPYTKRISSTQLRNTIEENL